MRVISLITQILSVLSVPTPPVPQNQLTKNPAEKLPIDILLTGLAYHPPSLTNNPVVAIPNQEVSPSLPRGEETLRVSPSLPRGEETLRVSPSLPATYPEVSLPLRGATYPSVSLPLPRGEGTLREGGCCFSCGYSWCPSTNNCVRPWETYCQELDFPYNALYKGSGIIMPPNAPEQPPRQVLSQ